MLIKSIDDKSKRLALLEELLQSPLLNSEQKIRPRKSCNGCERAYKVNAMRRIT